MGLLLGLGWFGLDKSRLYIVVEAAGLLLVVVLLGALGEGRFEVFFSLFAVVHFAVSALFRPRRRWFDVSGGALFLGFCYIVVVRILDIIR